MQDSSGVKSEILVNTSYIDVELETVEGFKIC